MVILNYIKFLICGLIFLFFENISEMDEEFYDDILSNINIPTLDDFQLPESLNPQPSTSSEVIQIEEMEVDFVGVTGMCIIIILTL